MEKIKLYGTPPSRALRAIWLLNELGLEHELVDVDVLNGENQTPEFLALNPAAKVPVLIDGDVVLTESAAMQLYLAEKRPEAGLIPADPAERGQMYRWMFFLVTEIEQPLWRIARHTLIYPEEERVPADIDLATRDCKAMVAVLEGHTKGREYLVGDRLSVADLNAAYTLDWARWAGMLGEAPVLRAYVEKMYARPKAPPTFAAAVAALKVR